MQVPSSAAGTGCQADKEFRLGYGVCSTEEVGMFAFYYCFGGGGWVCETRCVSPLHDSFCMMCIISARQYNRQVFPIRKTGPKTQLSFMLVAILVVAALSSNI